MRPEEVAWGEEDRRRAEGEQERAFCLALHRWDDHLDRCGECLSFGLHLCCEGELLSLECEEARDRVERAEIRRTLAADRVHDHRVPVPRRPALLGS